MIYRNLLRSTRRTSVPLARYVHSTQVGSAGLFGSLFGKKSENKIEQSAAAPAALNAEQQGAQPAELSAIEEEENAIFEPRTRPGFRRSDAVLDPDVVQAVLKDIVCAETGDKGAADWKAVSLTDVDLKVMAKAIEALNKNIPDRVIEHIRNGQDLYEFFTTKPHSSDSKHPVAKFFEENKDQLPSNLTFVPFHKHQRKLHVHS
ncbi:hypothetical protein EV182_002583 [Spiromyces aspiralis]|uniref:Uncharacterized protein n=1 Tax=Spiromyces aspiralis TaxID=68401 RepID=A0ACC1HDY2_9FUNG|nr:hypothetical protein EV182_002583 [Spiromyces aspiralis]